MLFSHSIEMVSANYNPWALPVQKLQVDWLVILNRNITWVSSQVWVPPSGFLTALDCRGCLTIPKYGWCSWPMKHNSKLPSRWPDSHIIGSFQGFLRIDSCHIHLCWSINGITMGWWWPTATKLHQVETQMWPAEQLFSEKIAVDVFSHFLAHRWSFLSNRWVFCWMKIVAGNLPLLEKCSPIWNAKGVRMFQLHHWKIVIVRAASKGYWWVCFMTS